jgi:hypothetical protein
VFRVKSGQGPRAGHHRGYCENLRWQIEAERFRCFEN